MQEANYEIAYARYATQSLRFASFAMTTFYHVIAKHTLHFVLSCEDPLGEAISRVVVT